MIILSAKIIKIIKNLCPISYQIDQPYVILDLSQNYKDKAILKFKTALSRWTPKADRACRCKLGNKIIFLLFYIFIFYLFTNHGSPVPSRQKSHPETAQLQ